MEGQDWYTTRPAQVRRGRPAARSAFTTRDTATEAESKGHRARSARTTIDISVSSKFHAVAITAEAPARRNASASERSIPDPAARWAVEQPESRTTGPPSKRR